jgi:DNA-binding NarL/FixJ family response regulator
MLHTILHADDHFIARAGFRAIINQFPEYKMLPGDIEDGRQTMDMISKYHPDIALVDLDMPKANGLQVVRYAREHSPTTIAVILSAHIDTVTYQEAIALGARGFLSKAAPPSEIRDCLAAVVSGERFVGEHLAQQLGSEMLKGNLYANEFDLLLKSLTAKEVEVLRLIMEGYTSQEIADSLHNSIKTIETHRSSITFKLDLKGSSRLSSFVTKNKVGLEKALSGSAAYHS